MLFNNKEIESSIIKDEDLGLYKLELPGIKRYFESVIFSIDGVKKTYGNMFSKYDNINFNNEIIGIIYFNNYYIVCFINLDNLNSEYYFVDSFEFIEINLKTYKYSVFIFRDFNKKLGFKIDYNKDDFSFELKNNIFSVNNNIFGSNVLLKSINLNNKLEGEKIEIINTTSNYLDIADLYIYDDFFIKSDKNNFNNFFDFISRLNNKNLKENSNLEYKLDIKKYNDLYSPKIKINVSIYSNNYKFELNNFRKLLLCFFPENTGCYLINSKEIENYFAKYLNDFTNLKFNKLDLDFKLPKNIYSGGENYSKFKLDLLKFRYNLYLLKNAYNNKNKTSTGGGIYSKLTNNRLELNKKSLEILIPKYELILSKFLDNIKDNIH